MNMIRALDPSDINQLKQIHEKFYKDEFDFPDFFNKFLCAYVVVDDESNKIISGGGVRTIIESVIITDKEVPIKERRSALYTMLDASIFISGKSGYNQVHAVVIDDLCWKRHLNDVGFRTCRGDFLVLNI